MQLNRIASIRISGRQRKERVVNLLYTLAHFRNLLIVFNQIYNINYNKFIINESYLYALLSNKPYKPRGEKEQEKLVDYNQIAENIEKIPELQRFLNQLKEQKEKIKNNYIIQTLIKHLLKDYKSFFKSIAEYKANPCKFKSIPKPPKAKKLKDTPSFTAELNVNTFKVIDGRYILVKLTFKGNPQYLKVKLPSDIKDIKSARIKFMASDVYVDVVYKKEIQETHKEQKYLVGIDVGLDNLLTIFSANPDIKTLIVSGKEIKSVNQWFNKEKAKLQSEIDLLQNQINKLIKEGLNTDELKQEIKTLINKQKQLSAYRTRWITDAFHKITRKIADYLYETGHKEVIIGSGATISKNEINLGVKTNQNFAVIPFRMLISQLKYKLQEHGITFTEITEEFTSKTSPFANLKEVIRQGKEYFQEKTEELKKKLKPLYQGKRVKRGLFKDFITDKAFNADAVGGYNILRKEAMPLIDKETLIDKLARPLKLKLNQLIQVTCESLCEIAGRRLNRVPCKVSECV